MKHGVRLVTYEDYGPVKRQDQVTYHASIAPQHESCFMTVRESL